MHGFLARFTTLGFSVLLCPVILGVSPGFAQAPQIGAGGNALQGAQGQVQRNLRGASQGPAPQAQPPVLPGTKAPSEAAPAEAGAAQMSPTEALFDAINRGDLPAARDAVNRGGDMNGQNLLGLTPLELAVDLGRNDISFMLLSMRMDDTSARRIRQQDTDLRVGETPKAAARPRVVAASARAPADEPDSIPPPRFYSGNGGTPIPAAGFLGFDSGRQSH